MYRRETWQRHFTLKLPDGSKTTVRLPQLSEEDRIYVRQRAESGKSEGKDKPAGKERPEPEPPSKK